MNGPTICYRQRPDVGPDQERLMLGAVYGYILARYREKTAGHEGGQDRAKEGKRVRPTGK